MNVPAADVVPWHMATYPDNTFTQSKRAIHQTNTCIVPRTACPRITHNQTIPFGGYIQTHTKNY
jgi:hypothetical protein